MCVLFFRPGRQQFEAARVSAFLQAMRLTSDTLGRVSESHMHAPQLSLRLLHLLPGSFPRLDPLPSGAAPIPLSRLQDDPSHSRQRSQQEEHQAPVTEVLFIELFNCAACLSLDWQLSQWSISKLLHELSLEVASVCALWQYVTAEL